MIKLISAVRAPLKKSFVKLCIVLALLIVSSMLIYPASIEAANHSQPASDYVVALATTRSPRRTRTPEPTAPADDVRIVVEDTYVHPTGWFSVPQLKGWEIIDGGEETVAPSNDNPLTRAGTTFVNSDALSVIHVFVEKDPDRRAKRLQHLDEYYTRRALNDAWENYDGWEETKRRMTLREFIIDFELYLDNQTYLARQISRFEGDWLMVQRLVVPGNNPRLLDQLQTTISTKFRLTPEDDMTPLPTVTPPPTLDPAALNFNSAKLFTSKDKVLKISLPRGWKEQGDTDFRGSYRFVIGEAFAPIASLLIVIGLPSEVYKQIGIADEPETPVDALLWIREKNFKENTGFKFSRIRPAKVGTFNGSMVTISLPSSGNYAAQEYNLRIAEVLDGKVIFVSIQTEAEVWEEIYPVAERMVESIVINLKAIPTPTKLALPHD